MKRILLSLCLLMPLMAGAETGTVVKSSELKTAPYADADNAGTLEAQTSVTILGRQGAWIHVHSSSGMDGWLKLFNVRTGSGTESGSSVTALGQLASMFHTGSSGTTVSTGVKGMSEEKLRNTQPNAEELSKFKSFASSPADARKYAQRTHLKPQSVAYVATKAGDAQ